MTTATSSALLTALQTPETPFPGLRPFQESESYLFFGRDEQLEKLLVKLSSNRFLAVVGTSGSGKSSLVRAGLLPALRGGMMPGTRNKWRIADLRPGNDPIGNLARALTNNTDNPQQNATQPVITEATLRLGSRGLLEAARQNVAHREQNLLVLVDQFEELFRFTNEARKAGNDHFTNDAALFIKLLLECVRPEEREANIYVVLTMRSDFLGDCAQFRDLPEAVTESQYLIPRLTRDQLREVIEGPVAVGGGRIASRLVNQLLNDIADNQDQLPILQHALMRTWEEWRAPRHEHLSSRDEIDLCCYDQTGGMANALSQHADEAFGELDARHQLVAEKMFKALTERGEDNREIRRPVTLGQLCAVAEASEGEAKTVIESFRQPGRSFLMPPSPTELRADSLIDISHESLIRVWHRLQVWVNEEAESAALYRRLADAARRKAELWRGKDLLEAEAWLEQHAPSPAWAQRYDHNYIDAIGVIHASRDRREAESQRAEQQQREFAERAQRELEQARALAEAQTLAARAEKQRADEQAKAAEDLRRLLTEVEQARDEAQKHKLLADSIAFVANMILAESEFGRGNRQRGYVLLEDYLHDDNAAQRQDDLRSFYWFYLWHQNHQEPTTLRGYWESVLSLAFSPDGRTLASGSDDHSVKLRDVSSRKELATLSGHGAAVSSVAFSPDGRTLASGSNDHSVKLWIGAQDEEIARQRNR